jgi:TolA-binding protein
MKTIEHEGQTYVLKTDMENAIQTRLQKMSARAAEAEQQAAQLQDTIDGMNGRLGALDNLQSQIDQYKEQLEQANGRFDRYQTVSKFGMTDTDQLELVEWQYKRTMAQRAKKDQQSLGDWLDGLVQDPSTAPIALRPHLQALAPKEATQVVEAAPQVAEAPQALPQPPRMNNGAITAPPTTENLVERGLRDLDFYRENREAIKKAFYNRQ